MNVVHAHALDQRHDLARALSAVEKGQKPDPAIVTALKHMDWVLFGNEAGGDEAKGKARQERDAVARAMGAMR